VCAVVRGEQVESAITIHVESHETFGIWGGGVVDGRPKRAVSVTELNTNDGRRRALVCGREILVPVTVEVPGHDAHAELRSGVVLRRPERAVPVAEENGHGRLNARSGQ